MTHIRKDIYMENLQKLHHQVEKIIKISFDNQNFLFRHYSKYPLAIRIELETQKKKLFYILQKKFNQIDNNILSYAAYILVIKSHYAFEKKFTTKQFNDMTLDEIQDISIIKLHRETEKKYLKNSTKRNKLLHYWSVIKMLRSKKEKPMSFTKISTYLKKYYNFEVSHNTIAVIWREIESKEK